MRHNLFFMQHKIASIDLSLLPEHVSKQLRALNNGSTGFQLTRKSNVDPPLGTPYKGYSMMASLIAETPPGMHR